MQESVSEFLARKGFTTRGAYGDFLYRNRKRLEKTRQQVAKETTLKVGRITKLETGKEEPTFKDLILLRHAKYSIADSLLIKFNPEYNPEVSYIESYIKIKKVKIDKTVKRFRRKAS
jgi:transcriptional regulator with XRE-family HTH domain